MKAQWGFFIIGLVMAIGGVVGLIVGFLSDYPPLASLFTFTPIGILFIQIGCDAEWSASMFR